jgi:hypothetical protein
MAQNNYTQPNLHVEKAKKLSEPTQADIAEWLDLADEESTERRGNSGLGAGAWLELTFDDDDPSAMDTDGERIDDLDHALMRELPLGNARQLRKFIANQRRNTGWDGHNHAQCPNSHSAKVLARIRA